MGLSIHAGMVVVADGSKEAGARLDGCSPAIPGWVSSVTPMRGMNAPWKTRNRGE